MTGKNINKTTTMEELAAILANHLHKHGIEAVVVGGFAVECYTHNRYLTEDIDLVDISYQSASSLANAMAGLGFYKQGRIFKNDNTSIVVEFPSAPLSVGDELITETTEYDSVYGKIPILKATDVVKDRLAAFFHWRDRQSLVQALCIMLEHELPPRLFNDFCKKEGQPESASDLQSLYKYLSNNIVKEIDEIENYVNDYFLK